MSYSCSYCGFENHDIRSCPSEDIAEMHDIMNTMYQNIYTNIQNHNQTKEIFINDVCRRFNSIELKAVQRRYCNYGTTSNKRYYATCIWEYFGSAPRLMQVNRPNITWFIDRRPDYSLLSSMQTNNQWSPWNGDFLQFNPSDFSVIRNLSHEFDAVQTYKKYPISPIILCTESIECLCLEEECGICWEPTKLINTITLGCNHKFCETCIKSTLEKHSNNNLVPSCALCREPMKNFTIKNPETFENISQYCL